MKRIIFTIFFALLLTEGEFRQLFRHHHRRGPGRFGVNTDELQSSFLGIGCYNRERLENIRRLDISSNTQYLKKSILPVYFPPRPQWCSDKGLLVPTYLKNQKSQRIKSPFAIFVNSFQQTHAFQVIVKSRDSGVTFKEVIIVARGTDCITSKNRGRFLLSENTELICCSNTDKDVARFKSNKGVKQTIFYWIPYEEVDNEFVGNFILQATVVKSGSEYWTNITSNTNTVFQNWN